MIKMRHPLELALAGLAVLAVAGCSAASTTHRAASSPAAGSAAFATHRAASSTAAWPVTSVHYTPNGNFGQSGQYLPGADGFNLADVDVDAKSRLDSLPAGVRGLVWLGDCGGATASFQAAVDAFAGDPKLFGFDIMDEPLPSACPAANLLAEDNWIHAHVPGARAFAILENLGRDTNPTFAGSYTPRNSGLDLVGIDPYPVRPELRSPDYGQIARYVRTAEASGWPQASIVPVYQAFGSGNHPDGAYSYWVLPTAAQERHMLADWAAVVPHPEFDYAYSWGSQEKDMSLDQSPALQAVFAAKNGHPKLSHCPGIPARSGGSAKGPSYRQERNCSQAWTRSR